MKNLALVLAFLLAFQPLGFSASEWDKAKPAGTDDRSDLDTILQVNNEAVDRLVSNYRRGMVLAFATTATLTAGVGEVTCSNAAGTLRKFRANTAATTITWANIDTGAEANSTTYYVYAVADADATTATFKISASSTTPTGATYYKRLGSFYNNSSGNIDTYSVVNDIPIAQVGLGALVSSLLNSTVYKAETDGFVIVIGYTNTENPATAYTDENSNPTTVMGQATGVGGFTGLSYSITMPVKKNNYWKVVASSSPAIYFLPLGS